MHCALVDLRWTTGAGPAHKHIFALALDDMRSHRRQTSGAILGDQRWRTCAGVDQRTTSDRELGDLRWWTALVWTGELPLGVLRR